MVLISKTKHKILPFLPLILVELYLGFTLLLYQFGPIMWQAENVGLFWFYIAAYHIAFITGYLLFIKKFKISGQGLRTVKKLDTYIVKYMWAFLLLNVILALIKYRNVVYTDNFLPTSLPSEFIKGLINPGAQYHLKFSKVYDGNKLITAIYALFSFVSWSMIPVCVFYWNKIKKSQKLVFFVLVCFEFATWVSIGTNKGIFDLLFLFATCLAIDVIVNFKRNRFKTLKQKYSLIVITLFLLIFSFWFFTNAMTTRAGSIEKAVNVTKGLSTRWSMPLPTAVGNLVYGLTSYICQGYYGMSLALDEPFTSTYGIGNSFFLMSNFKSIFNIDVFPNTYQMKVNDKWSALGQWHTFYSYMANDIHFIGVIFLMLIIGAFCAITWKEAIYGKNVVSQSLLTLFVILFLYMPANNQVFGSLQTFCAFFELTFIWFGIRYAGKKFESRLGIGNGKS